MIRNASEARRGFESRKRASSNVGRLPSASEALVGTMSPGHMIEDVAPSAMWHRSPDICKPEFRVSKGICLPLT